MRPFWNLQEKNAGVVFWFVSGFILIAALVVVFVLPFHSPSHLAPTFSAAYMAGSDNRVASAGLAVLSLCAFLWALRMQGRPGWPVPASVPPAGLYGRSLPLTRSALLAGCLLIACWTAAWTTAIARSGMRVGEMNYFLEQTRNSAGIGLPHGLTIYKSLEFPYGPLLLEPAVWLWALLGRVGVSVVSCYIIALAAVNVMGVLLAWFTLNSLPLLRAPRLVLFAICCLEAMHPLFGPNYSLTKFLIPVVVILLAGRLSRPWFRLLMLSAGTFLTLMISPELGVGLSAAAIALSVTSAFWQGGQVRPAMLAGAAGPLLGYVAFTACYGTTYLQRLRHASGGALNLVIQPLPDVLIMVVATAWLIPVLLGTLASAGPDGAGSAQSVSDSRRPVLLAIFVLGLGMLPGALGRADPLHVFFNGLPLFILSCVLLNRVRPRWRVLWLSGLVVLALQVQASNFETYARSLRDVLTHLRHPVAPIGDMAALDAATHGHAVALPVLYGISLPDEMQLRRGRLLIADPAPGLAEVWDERTEREHVSRLRQSTWALVPDEDWILTERLAPRIVDPRQAHDGLAMRTLRSFGHTMLGFNYPQKNPAFQVGKITKAELQTNWTLDRQVGRYLLYRRWR